MAGIFRVRAALSGWPSGGPGVMTHFFADNDVDMAGGAQTSADRVRDALIAGRNLFTAALTWTVSSQVDRIDLANGNVTATLGVTGSTGVGGSGTGWAPTPIAVMVRFETDLFIAGHRVRGRTYLSPIDVSMMEGDGTPSAVGLAHAESFATAMEDEGLTGIHHVIWHRPSPGGTDGQVSVVTGHIVPNKYAILRSRRD